MRGAKIVLGCWTTAEKSTTEKQMQWEFWLTLVKNPKLLKSTKTRLSCHEAISRENNYCKTRILEIYNCIYYSKNSLLHVPYESSYYISGILNIATSWPIYENYSKTPKYFESTVNFMICGLWKEFV